MISIHIANRLESNSDIFRIIVITKRTRTAQWTLSGITYFSGTELAGRRLHKPVWYHWHRWENPNDKRSACEAHRASAIVNTGIDSAASVVPHASATYGNHASLRLWYICNQPQPQSYNRLNRFSLCIKNFYIIFMVTKYLRVHIKITKPKPLENKTWLNFRNVPYEYIG